MRLRNHRPQLLLLSYFVISTGINAYFIAPASVAPFLINEHGIDKATAGLAVSVPILGAVLLQIPGGFLMDRYDNRILLFWATLVFALTTVAGVSLSTYPMWLASRFLAGVCSIFMFTMGAKVIAEVFPPSSRGIATTAFTASAPMGVALGQFAGPRLASAFGLDKSFVVYSAISIVGYGLFYLSSHQSIHSKSQIKPGALRRVLTNRGILLMSISAAGTYALYFFLNAWMPTYGTEVLTLPLESAGAIAALVPIMGIFGRPGGGWLSDRIGRRRPVVIGAVIIALPVFAVITLAPTLNIFALLLLLTGFVLQLAMGVYFVFVQELAGETSVGSALAVFGTVGFTGSLASPIAGGWLIDTFSWKISFGVYVIVGIISVLAILFVVEH